MITPKTAFLKPAMALLACAGALLATADAHAVIVNEWGTPGMACVPDLSSVLVSAPDINGVHNSSSSQTANVLCPITSTQGANLQQLNLLVYDRSSTEEVSCSLYVNDGTGTVSFVQTTGSGVTLNQVAAKAIGFTTFGGLTYGATVTCSMPKLTASGASGVSLIKQEDN